MGGKAGEVVAMKWTTRKIEYLEGHADDGATVIANQLGRFMQPTKTQAMRYRLALRRALRCPKCGMHVHTSLSPKAGWCRVCTLEHRNERIAGRVRGLKEGGEERGEREARAPKALQRKVRGQDKFNNS